MKKFCTKIELQKIEAEAGRKGWTVWVIRFDRRAKLYELWIDLMD